MNSTGKYILVILVLSLAFLPLQVFGAAKAQIDFSAPSVPAGLTVDNRTYSSLMISWNAASDNTGVRGYQVYRDGRKIITITKTSFTNTDLVPGREYVYTIRAYDAAGNVSDGSIALKAATLNDTVQPTVPDRLSVVSASFTTISLGWKPSSDNTGIKGYEIYCNGSRKASTTSTSYTCKGLIPGKSYEFTIKSYDIAGNYSNASSSITASTPADREKPSMPAGLKITKLSGTEAEIEWIPSSDNVKVKGYEVFCEGDRKGTISKTAFKLKQLIPGKCYNVTVRAFDVSGNMSDMPNTIKIATARDIEAPSTPTRLKVKSVKGTSVSLTWNQSDDDIKVKGYRIYCNGLPIATSTKTSRTVKVSKDFIMGIFHVKSYDLAENLSASSNKVTVLF